MPPLAHLVAENAAEFHKRLAEHGAQESLRRGLDCFAGGFCNRNGFWHHRGKYSPAQAVRVNPSGGLCPAWLPRILAQ